MKLSLIYPWSRVSLCRKISVHWSITSAELTACLISWCPSWRDHFKPLSIAYPRAGIHLFLPPKERFRVNPRSLHITSFAILNYVEYLWLSSLEGRQHLGNSLLDVHSSHIESLRGLQHVKFSSMVMALNHNFLAVLRRNMDYLVLRLNHEVISFQDLSLPDLLKQVRLMYTIFIEGKAWKGWMAT